jgi:CHAT domain-containing protein
MQLLPMHAAWYINEIGQKCTLLDMYEIIYAPSTYAYSIACNRANKRKGNSALIVGVNNYKKHPLSDATLEVETIAKLLNVKPFCDFDATKQNVKANSTGSAYFHFSCHGTFNWDLPLESALILANDDPLKLKEIISDLDLNSARLVTLSACETGVSDISQSPDEYLSLPAGFMQAGAPAIVCSLWIVDDHSTFLLMERFYHNHLKRNMTYSAALREAQIWLRNLTVRELGIYYKSQMTSTSKCMNPEDAWNSFSKIALYRPDERPYTNSYYWAAFILNGADE